MTSVLIVEDQRMPRENMEHLVEDSGRYRRVASLSTAEMALAQCARHSVDLVLMDVCTKGSRDGIDVAAEIKARYPETKVIIITSMVEESYLKRAKAAGAESFWYKDVSPESLLEVMDRTMAGESLYPDRTPETRLGQVSSTQLTPREIEVLRLVCEGLEYEEIAAELNLPIEKIIEANRTAADTLSLDMPVGDEEDTTIGSFVEDDNTPGPVDATSNAMLSEALTEILGTLTEREADVLRMRFGMYDGRTHTLEEVGQIFGVTRERIRQIENKAIRKLRHPSRAKKIKDFYC